jgi:hypothetical protein
MTQIISTDIGPIYFIRERDLVTGHVNPYVSIGLDKDNLLSQDQRDRLASGNPRQLYVDHVVDTACATAIATVLRFEFMDQAVRPNWYYFGENSPKKVGDLYERCTELSKEFTTHSTILNKAFELAKVVSTPEMTELSLESVNLEKSYLLHDQVVRLCTVIKPQRPESLEPTTKKTRRLLDFSNDRETESVFKRTYPDLYKAFLKTFVDSSQFAVFGQLWDEEISKDHLIHRTQDLIRSYFRTFVDTDIVGDVADAIVMARFRLHQLSKYSEIQREIALRRLQVACGTSRGITGICTWERTAHELVDLEAIKSTHPELWTECFGETLRWW